MHKYITLKKTEMLTIHIKCITYRDEYVLCMDRNDKRRLLYRTIEVRIVSRSKKKIKEKSCWQRSRLV